jgi:hypothetical protein
MCHIFGIFNVTGTYYYHYYYSLYIWLDIRKVNYQIWCPIQSLSVYVYCLHNFGIKFCTSMRW